METTEKKTTTPSPEKRAISQVKLSFIRQVGNVLLKSLTAFLSRLLGRFR